LAEYKEIRDLYLGATWPTEEELPHRMRIALKFLKSASMKTFLDVGCGDGNFASIVKRATNGVDVYGTDISQKAVKLATDKGITAFCVDLSYQRIPVDSDYFDAVFAGEVIEHVFDTDHFLDEIYRVLKPTGTLILTTPNLSSLYNRLALLIGYEPFTNNPSLRYPLGHITEFEPGRPDIVPSGDHIRVMTLKSLRMMLNLHSFVVTDIRGDEAVFRANSTFLKLVRSFDVLVRKAPRLSYRVVAFCKKPESIR
jgi:SAM-dependent methyltransferase